MTKRYKEVIDERLGNMTFSRKALIDIDDLLVQLRVIEKNQKNRKNEREHKFAKETVKKAEELKAAINHLRTLI